MNQESKNPATAYAQLFSLVSRILLGVYLVFWLCLVVCCALIASVWFIDKQVDLSSAGAAATSWTDWQFFFIALALASVYASFRLNGILLRPERLWKGTTGLPELAAALEAEGKIKSGTGEGLDEISAHREVKTKKQKLYVGAVQHLLSKIVFSHLLLWSLAVIPLLLGLIDRFWHDDWRLYTWLVLLSVVILILRRPSRKRLNELLEPLMTQGGYSNDH